MPDSITVYQYLLTILLLVWIVPLVAIWVRYDRMPHNKLMLLAVFCWPLLLVDEWLRAYGLVQNWFFFSGVFQFVPVLLIAWLVLSTRKLVLEKPVANYLKFYVPTFVMIAAQIPFLLLAAESKMQLFSVPPVGGIYSYWMYYLPYFFSAIALLLLSTQGAEWINEYHHTLSEQVVDVNFYQYRTLYSGFLVSIGIAFIEITLVLLAAFELVAPTFWQSAINIINAVLLFFLMLVLLEKRRYAPSPIEGNDMEKYKFSEEHLRDVLSETEKAIIRHKAYKRIGLRLRQLADAADVEPIALVIATRTILNRNFRAFIYHYRLEYAKKVLMRTDAKVSTVAKRLGFNSEKYLSEMFIKYVRVMGREQVDKDDDGLF